jgi:hypothetical protein
MLRAYLSQNCTGRGPGSQRQPHPTLLMWVAPPELRVQAAAPLELLGSFRQIPIRSHPLVHLLHVCAEDEYHECIRVT